MTLRVVKLGGSLLDLSDVADRLRAWLRRQTPGHAVVVVGGGAAADSIRVADRGQGLDREEAHWLAVAAMSETASRIALAIPECARAEDLASVRRRPVERQRGEIAPTIMDVEAFLRDEEPRLPGTRLPASWDVTSDSIAARLAIALGADELVLLKSRLPPAGEDAGVVGYVDRFFARLAHELPRVRAVDLRMPGFAEAPLRAAAPESA